MIVYKIVDIKTSKTYVGKSTRSLEERKKEHLYALSVKKHHNKYLQNVYSKDPNRLIFQIIEEGITSLEELNKREQIHIQKLDCINMTLGGEGGDTLSKHPNKEEIFKKRSISYKKPEGKESLNYIELPIQVRHEIVNTWKSLKTPTLTEVSKATQVSKYLCKRTLIEENIKIPNKYETLKHLYKTGELSGSRKSTFSEEQIKYIIKRYTQDWKSCKFIAKELGFKSESAILKVVKDLGINKTRSEWTTYNNNKGHKD